MPTGQRFVRLLQTSKAPVVDEAQRTVELSFSSEAPVDRWFGMEVLSHAPGAADLVRLNSRASLLFNHDWDDVLGVVESAAIDSDGKGRAVVRFGRDDRGEWAMQQIADGILCNVSFTYVVNRYEESADASTPETTYVATSWTALEISIVTVPADIGVGIGRSHHSKERTMEQETLNRTDIDTRQPSRRQRHNQAEAVEHERERIQSIRAACRTYNMNDAVDDFIADGALVDDVRAEALRRMGTRSVRPVAALTQSGNDQLGLSDREAGEFSLVRAINAQLSGDWSGAGFERECSRAVAQKLNKQTQGFFVPRDVRQRSQWDERQTRAAYQVGATATGGAAVATNLLPDFFIEALRNRSQVMNAGATVLDGLTGNVDIPRRITTTATSWVAEGGVISESEATFDKVSLRPKTVGALSKMSRLMLLQSTPAIEMMTRSDLMQQIGIGIDLAALSGPGTGNQPTGVANTSGIGNVILGTNGAAVNLDVALALETALANSNAPLDRRGYIWNTKTIGTLKTLKSSTGQYLWTTDAPGQRSGTPLTFNGYPVYASNQARSTLTKGTSVGVCSELFFGAWSELLIGSWGVLEIMVNPFDSTGFTTGDVLIRAMQTLDIAVRHAASFATISDALTP